MKFHNKIFVDFILNKIQNTMLKKIPKLQNKPLIFNGIFQLFVGTTFLFTIIAILLYSSYITRCIEITNPIVEEHIVHTKQIIINNISHYMYEFHILLSYIYEGKIYTHKTYIGRKSYDGLNDDDIQKFIVGMVLKNPERFLIGACSSQNAFFISADEPNLVGKDMCNDNQAVVFLSWYFLIIYILLCAIYGNIYYFSKTERKKEDNVKNI